MRKITIGNQDYLIAISGLSMKIYKEEFRRDLYSDLTVNFDVLASDTYSVCELLYTMIKSTRENNYTGTFEEFLMGIDRLNELVNDDIFDAIMQEIFTTFNTTKEEVKEKAKAKKTKK